MDHLIQSYKETRKILIKARERAKQKREQLKNEKISQLAKLTVPTAFEKQRLETEKTMIQIEIDLKIMGGMIADIEYALLWMHTGRQPGNRRGIERRAVYQREKLVEPKRMQVFCEQSTSKEMTRLSDWKMFQIQDALSRLSARERECYVLAYGECFSHSEIANLLHISKSAVEKYLHRAQGKIAEDLQNSLFLLG